MNNFILVVEPGFYSSFLCTKWIGKFWDSPNFKGVAIAKDYIPEQSLKEKKALHEALGNLRNLSDKMISQTLVCYPDFNEVGKSLVSQFGFPKFDDLSNATYFWGQNLNGPDAKTWIESACENNKDTLFVFIFVDQILEEWWFQFKNCKIINGHPAILPIARGVRAIEHIASLRNINKFLEVAGATVHYVNKGIDTGNIILSERIINPFQFETLADLRAFNFNLVFELMIETASNLISRPETAPAGIQADKSLAGPLFLRRYSTPELRDNAKKAFVSMKNEFENEK